MSKGMGNLCVCFASEYGMDIGDLVGFRLGMVNCRFTFLQNPDPSGFLVGLMDPHAIIGLNPGNPGILGHTWTLRTFQLVQDIFHPQSTAV